MLKRLTGAIWFLATVALLAAWYQWVAPTYVGGKSTYVLVHGVSMEPMLHTGDLAVARTEPKYQVGDLVVFQVGDQGQVIHKLYKLLPNGYWKTKGIHNTWVDPWTVPPKAVLGQYQFFVPQAGNVIGWAGQNSLLLGFGFAALALVPYLPRHRRRLAEELKVALRFSTREPRRDGRTNAEYGVFGISLLGTAAVFYMTVRLYAEHQLYTPAGFTLLAADLVSLGITAGLIYRLYDGRGVREPSASMYALAGRLHLVEAFPKSAATATPVKSVIELRKIAEEHRLPVLHRIDAVTGQHSFLLITAKRGIYIWQPPRRSAGYGSKLFEAPEKKPAGAPKTVKRTVKAVHRA